MAISKKRSSTLYRVTYKRRGWKTAKSRLFGTNDSAERFVAKLNSAGTFSRRGDVRVLAPLTLLRTEAGVVSWENLDEMVIAEPQGQAMSAVRQAALGRFLSRYGHEYGSDPDDIYDLRELEQEIRNDPTE